MSQTLAIFGDAYRGLKARKMFWIVLVISFLVVASFGCLGISEKGLTLLAWELGFGPNTRDLSADVFYKSMFVGLGIGFWLSWVAAILALVSTAGIIPAFLAQGAVDLVLSRPISRGRLFLTQYAAGLMFVFLQITIFCVASFLVIGLRGGAWEPGIFIAVPLVVCFFSYLFSICVLLGVLTRSTVAALLLTLVFWGLLAGLHMADTTLLMVTELNRQEQTRVQEQIDATTAQVEAPDGGDQGSSSTGDERSDLKQKLADLHRQNDSAAGGVRKLQVAHRIIYSAKTFLPKTSETVDLLERTLISTAELPSVQSGDNPVRAAQARAAQYVAQRMRTRSAVWIIGTSLAFEAVVLALGAWVFCRRDF